VAHWGQAKKKEGKFYADIQISAPSFLTPINIVRISSGAIY
jgi:hypothetical protein